MPRSMYCCSLCVAVGNQIYRNSRKGGNSETPSNISIRSWATAPKRPESGSQPCLTLQHDKIAFEEHNQWPESMERGVWRLKTLRNRTAVSLCIKGIWNLKQSPKRGKLCQEGNIQTPPICSITHFHLFYPVTPYCTKNTGWICWMFLICSHTI